MRLHVGESAIEQPASALDRQTLRLVDIVAATVIAAARIAFGVLVGQNRPLRLHDRPGNDVLAGDQLDLILLAMKLTRNRGEDIRIRLGETETEEPIEEIGRAHV